MRLPSICFGLLCLLLAFTEAAAQEFPSELLSSVPTAAEKLLADDIKIKVSILDELVVPVPQSCTLEQRFTQELSKNTYEFVVGKILENDLRQLDQKLSPNVWSKLSFVITRLELKQFAPLIAEYVRGSDWRTQAAVIGLLNALNARYLDADVAFALNSQEKYVREEALSILIRFESARAIPSLVERLNDPDENKRYYALDSLAKVKARNASSAIAKLIQDEKPNIRYWALDTLVKVGAKERSAQIWYLIDSGQTLQTEMYALAALVNFDDAKAIPIAAARIASATEGSGELLDHLTRLKAVSIVPSLVHILDNPLPSTPVYGRSDIVYALGKLNAKESSGSLRKYISRYPGWITPAIQVLGDFEDREAVDDLLDIFYRYAPNPPASISNETFQSSAAAFALAQIGDRKTFAALINAAENPRYPTRSQVIQELNKHLDPQLWKRIQETKIKGEDFGSIKLNAELLSKETSIPISLEYDPATQYFRFNPPGVYPGIRISPGQTLRATLAEIVSSIDSGTTPNRFTFVIDNGTIRVVTVEVAVKWWREKQLKDRENKNAGT